LWIAGGSNSSSRVWRPRPFTTKANRKTVEYQAARILAERADEVLYGPRQVLGPPWAKDHRIALAATIVAAAR